MAFEGVPENVMRAVERVNERNRQARIDAAESDIEECIDFIRQECAGMDEAKVEQAIAEFREWAAHEMAEVG